MMAEVIIFGTGAILVIIAIVGGGLKIKEISLPQLTNFSRIAAAITGVLFIILGIWMQLGGGSGIYKQNDVLSGHWIGTTSNKKLTARISLKRDKDDKDYLCNISAGEIISLKDSAEESAEEECTISIRGNNISIFSKVKETDSQTGWDPDDFELQLNDGRLIGHLISKRESYDIIFRRM